MPGNVFIRLLLDYLFIFYMSMWIIFPAYLANAVMVPVSRRLEKRGWNHSMDGGKFLGETRVLGAGKTIEGALAGTTIGILGGIVQLLLAPAFQFISLKWHGFYGSLLVANGDIMFYIAWNRTSMIRALIFPPGAILGDMMGSFIKRRMHVNRGESLPLLDQLDFIIGVILFSLVSHGIGASLIQVSPLYLVPIIILTPLIHLAVNRVAFKTGIKDVPH
ncbi:CDP-archaeol synthase [Candidatus Bathyarchaeota archaeon]|nr:CDP-archaeol synthase [Candidatus Bathyarchaeota archaeon]